MKTRTTLAITCLGAALPFVSVPSQAAVDENASVDVGIFGLVPCAAGGAGEFVDLSGRFHFLETFTISDHGNIISGVSKIQSQDISGTGETTGTKYQAVGVFQTSFKQSFLNGQANMTMIANFSIIGAGPGNNALMVATSHVTFNADGTMTASVDNVHVECK